MILQSCYITTLVSNFCFHIFSHAGHDTAASVCVCARVSALSQLGISIQRNLLLLAHLALKCCVVANIGCREINKLYEGLITLNPLESNLRRHIAACLHLMCFCFRGDRKEMRVGVRPCCGITLTLKCWDGGEGGGGVLGVNVLYACRTQH